MPITTNLRLLDLTHEEEGTASLVQTMEAFLAQFRWAKIKGLPWVGESIPGVVGVFLVELEILEEDVDRYIWVIVGDMPPAYISSQYASSPREALECYVAEMRAWVEAVRKGDLTDDLIPVDAAPTEANAAALDSRLAFLESNIVPDLQ